MSILSFQILIGPLREEVYEWLPEWDPRKYIRRRNMRKLKIPKEGYLPVPDGNWEAHGGWLDGWLIEVSPAGFEPATSRPPVERSNQAEPRAAECNRCGSIADSMYDSEGKYAGLYCSKCELFHEDYDFWTEPRAVDEARAGTAVEIDEWYVK